MVRLGRKSSCEIGREGLTSSSEDTEVTEAIEAEPREETPGLTIRHGERLSTNNTVAPGHWQLLNTN